MVCQNGQQNGGNGGACDDYEMTFCCEGCCPKLNVTGDPEVTDYYEDYPSIYVLVDETFNGERVYRPVFVNQNYKNRLRK